MSVENAEQDIRDLIDALNPNKEKPLECSICFRMFTEFGNNAEPINEGRCCDSCNTKVVLARIQRSKNRRTS